MAPRDPSLPEGTDHIIDTNIDLGDTGGGSGGGGAGGLGGGSGGAGGLGGGAGATGGTTGLGGGSGATGGAGTTGGTGTGGTGGGSAFQFDKSGGGSGSGGSSGGNRSSGIAGQVREQISTLKSQAGDRARSFADDGKTQATSFLQTVAQIVADAAGSVEERLGSQYAGMGHRASTSINSLASTLDERSVDDLIEDARAFAQRSPALAIGAAAVLGFAVARVVRSTVSEYNSETGNSSGTGGAMGATGGTGMGAGASGGLDATSGGFGEQGVGTAGTMGSGGVSTGPGSTGGTGNAPTI
jgi:hypothetical protein